MPTILSEVQAGFSERHFQVDNVLYHSLASKLKEVLGALARNGYYGPCYAHPQLRRRDCLASATSNVLVGG